MSLSGNIACHSITPPQISIEPEIGIPTRNEQNELIPIRYTRLILSTDVVSSMNPHDMSSVGLCIIPKPDAVVSKCEFMPKIYIKNRTTATVWNCGRNGLTLWGI